MLCTAFALSKDQLKREIDIPRVRCSAAVKGMGKWLRAGCYPPTASRIAWVGHRYGQAASPGLGIATAKPHRLGEGTAVATRITSGSRSPRPSRIVGESASRGKSGAYS